MAKQSKDIQSTKADEKIIKKNLYYSGAKSDAGL